MQRWRKHLLLCVWLALALAGEWRLDAAERWLVEAWRTENGLPQNIVTSLAQTDEGYLWVGTLDGLARFDGVRVVTFGEQGKPGLKSSRVQALAADNAGGLWIATDGGGVSWASMETGEFRHYDTDDGLVSDRVQTLALSGQGEVWVVTVNGFLQRLVNNRFETFDIGRQMDGAPWSLSTDSRGHVWVAGPGFCGVLRGESSWQLVHDQPGVAVFTGPGTETSHWIVAGTNVHEVRLDTMRVRKRYQVGARMGVTTIFGDSAGRVWLGTSGGGLLWRSPTQRTWQNLSLRDALMHPHVLALREDVEGNLWAGTQGGLCRVKPEVFRIHRQRDGLSEDVVLSVCEGPDGTIWSGSTRGGLNVFRNGQWQTLTTTNGLARDAVWAVYATAPEEVWIGTWGGGLQRFRQGNFETFGPETGMTARIIRAIAQDRKGRMWFGSQDAGAFVFEEGRFKQWSMKEGLSNNDVRLIHEDLAGRVWLGTSFGLNIIDNGRIRRIGRRDGLGSDFVRAIYEDDSGVLWIGTGGAGVVRWRNGELRAVNSALGLPNDYISQILSDGRGNLWFGSNGGIFRVNEKNLHAVADGASEQLSYASYNESDGIDRTTGGFQPSGWRTRDGRLLVPLVSGLAELNPAQLNPPQPPPRVRIEELLVDDHVQPRGGVIRVPSSHRSIQFRFTAFSFAGARRIQFEHQLQGWDAKPIRSVENRVATYPHLKPGNYTFRVTAANKDGVWNLDGATLQLVIVPALWETAWFRLLLGISVAAGLVIAVRAAFTRRMRRRLRLLEEQNALQQERARIAKDMHDDIGARLTQIAILSDLFARGKSPASVELPTKIGSLTRDVVQALDEIVWAVNPRNDSLDHLVRYLLNYAEEYLATGSIRCRTTAPTELPASPVSSDTRHHLYLAVKEALNNIVKHSGANEVHVEVVLSDHELMFRLQDDGRGLPAERQQRHGEGLENLHRRLEEVGGSAEISNAPGGGCTVTFRLPLRPD